MTALPTLKARVKVDFPAQVTGTGGIGVDKTAGVWVIHPDFDDLASISASAVTDPSLQQIWIWNSSTDDYNVLTLGGLGDALYKATSTTSLLIATGTKTFDTQQNKDFGIGAFVLATSDGNSSNFMLGQVTSYSGTSLVLSVTTTGGSGTKADWTLRASAAAGSAGKSAGLPYSWLTSNASSDPGAGGIKVNNSSFGSITSLFISETDADGNALAAVIAGFGAGTSTTKGRIFLYNPVTPTNFMVLDTTALADNGAWDTITVTPISSGGSFAASDALRLLFVPVGDKGTTGTGGASSGVPWNFASSTTMADPSAGNIRLNNATLSSVTAIAVSANSADSGNPSVSAYVNAWDDSTTTGHRGYLLVRKVSAPQNFAIYDVTAALTDNSTWLQIVVSHVVSNGTFSAADSLYTSFHRTGDKGAAGAGAGDLISTNNLSDVTVPATARSNLGLAIGTNVQAFDATLLSIALLGTAADKLAYTTGIDTWAETAFTAAGRALVDDANAAAQIVTLGAAALAGNQNLTGGFTATSFSAGTKTSGTFTPDPTSGNVQHVTNGGAHTLAPPSSSCTIILEYLNNGSAGAITTSGFTKVTGDTQTTTNGNKFMFFITKTQNYSHLHVQALQ